MKSQGWGLHPPKETGENRIINSGMSGDEPGRVGQISSKDSLGAGEQESREESVTTAQGVEARRQQRRPRRGR